MIDLSDLHLPSTAPAIEAILDRIPKTHTSAIVVQDGQGHWFGRRIGPDALDDAPWDRIASYNRLLTACTAMVVHGCERFIELRPVPQDADHYQVELVAGARQMDPSPSRGGPEANPAWPIAAALLATLPPDLLTAVTVESGANQQHLRCFGLNAPERWHNVAPPELVGAEALRHDFDAAITLSASHADAPEQAYHLAAQIVITRAAIERIRPAAFNPSVKPEQ